MNKKGGIKKESIFSTFPRKYEFPQHQGSSEPKKLSIIVRPGNVVGNSESRDTRCQINDNHPLCNYLIILSQPYNQ